MINECTCCFGGTICTFCRTFENQQTKTGTLETKVRELEERVKRLEEKLREQGSM